MMEQYPKVDKIIPGKVNPKTKYLQPYPDNIPIKTREEANKINFYYLNR